MNTMLNSFKPTPLVKLATLSNALDAQIYLKLERYNPGGSIKDRPAKYIIDQAEQKGLLKPGGVIIESSSGNFGIACAMIGAAKGYKVIILIDPKTTNTNKSLMQAFGATTIVVSQKDDSGAYHKTRIAMAQKLHQEIPNSFWPNQCFNLANSECHYTLTAPEILNQCNGELDYLIAAVSTGGQIGGIARYFKQYSPTTKIIAVDAIGSTAFGGQAQPYLLPGVGLGWTPSNISNLELIDTVYKIHDNETFSTCRLIARQEGILTGGSTGANVFTAINLIQRQKINGKIVCISADSGERYLDTIYNDKYLMEHNLDTNCSLENVIHKAKQLVPYSENPIETANYNTSIVNEISQLATTMQLEQSYIDAIKAR